MNERIRLLYLYALLIGLSLLLLLLPLTVPAVTTDEDFSIYNTSWNGCSSLAVKSYRLGGIKPTFNLRGTGSYLEIVQLPPEEWNLDPGRDSLIIIGPSMAFTERDRAVIGGFLESGGVVLLADDFGEGNTLLKGLNTSTRFSGKLALDLSFSKKGEFMMVSDITPSTLTENVTFLLLNYPSTLKPSPGATPLAYSSPASWLEVERNERMDPEEPRGPFPLIAVERVGSGVLITVSDPSIFINQMLGKADNGVFTENLMKYLTGGGRRVLFDEYHRQYSNPLIISSTLRGDVTFGYTPLLPAILLLLGLLYAGGVHRLGGGALMKLLNRLLPPAEEPPGGAAVDPLKGLEGSEREEAGEILKEIKGIYRSDRERKVNR